MRAHTRLHPDGTALDFSTYLGGSEDEISALKSDWATALRDNRHQERLTTKNQLYGWRPFLVFHFEGDDGKTRPLPEGVADAIRADVRSADESVAGTHSRQSVINTASNVLLMAGLTEDARALLLAEIEKDPRAVPPPPPQIPWVAFPPAPTTPGPLGPSPPARPSGPRR